jgi:hypothetical protein
VIVLARAGDRAGPHAVIVRPSGAVIVLLPGSDRPDTGQLAAPRRPGTLDANLERSENEPIHHWNRFQMRDSIMGGAGAHA